MAGALLYFYSRTLTAETRYDTLLSKMGEVSYKVDLLINFGNGTKIWYNETYIPISFNLFNLTLKATRGDVEFTKGQYGIFVNSIGGVGANPVSKSYAWLWWRFNESQGRWLLGETGADQYRLSGGEIVAWYYQDTSTFPNLKPPS